MSKRSSRTASGAQPEPVDAPAAATPKSSLPEPLNQQDVADLAYQRWVERGCPQGSPEEDWFEAERQVSSRSHS